MSPMDRFGDWVVTMEDVFPRRGFDALGTVVAIYWPIALPLVLPFQLAWWLGGLVAGPGPDWDFPG